METQIDFNEAGKKNTTNISPFGHTMISKTLDQLELADYSLVLETGFKSREFLPFLFQKIRGIGYYGNTISEALVLGASCAPALKINEGTAQFSQAKEEGTLDFGNNFFDGCFTLNTIYFWKDPISHLKEIHRVLRPGGQLSLSFLEKKNGAELPWTQADFTFYEVNAVKTFFREAGFVNIKALQMTEEVTGQDGKGMVRPFINIVGKKQEL